MPPLTDSELNSFLEKAPIARLCTHNSNGSIHSVPAWFKYDNGEIVFGTQDDTQRIANIKKNSDVTVLVDMEALPYQGAVIYGKARLDYDNVIPKRVAIFEKYMPKANAEKLANGLAALRKPVVVRVKPTKIISYDYAKDSTGLFS